MDQISESEYNEFLKYKQAKKAKEDKKLQKAKKQKEDIKNAFNEINTLIIPEENFDLIYERNKFVKSYEKHGKDKYSLKDLESFNKYLLNELEERAPKLSNPEKLKSYIEHKCNCDIGSYADGIELSTDDIERDVYKLIENEYDYNEKDRYLYLIEKYASKIKEKYSKLFE